MAYNPNLPNQQPYAPPTGNNVAGGGQGNHVFQAQGQTGAMTSGSLKNAVMNQSAAPKQADSGNAFAGMSGASAAMYSALKGVGTQAPSVGGTLSNGAPSVGRIGTGATIGQPPPMQEEPSGNFAGAVAGLDPAVAASMSGVKDPLDPLDPLDPTAPTVPPVPPVVPPAAPVPPVVPPVVPPANNGPTPPGLLAATGGDQAGADRIWAQANKLAASPGFEWLKQHPQILAQYETTPGAKNEPFSVWAGRNWEDLAKKMGMNPADQQNFGHFVRKTQYEQQTKMLRDQLYAKDPTMDNQWITPQMVAKYEDYKRANPTVNVDFYTWAGNKGETAGDPNRLTPDKFSQYGKNGARDNKQIASLAGDASSNPENFLDHPDFQDPQSQRWLRALMQKNKMGGRPGAVGGAWGAGTYGQAGSPPMNSGAGGAGGPGGSNWQSGPQGGYEGGNQYLETLKQAIGSQQGENLDKVMREFRHNAALGGMQDQGSYGTMSNELMRGTLGDMNKQLNEVMFTGNENEQERSLKMALARISSGDSRYSSDAGASAANAGAQASMYGADRQNALGMAGLDFDRWKFSQSLPLDYWKLLNEWFGTIGGMPGPNGPPSPGIPNQT